MNHFFDVGANTGQTFDDYLLKGDRHDGETIWCFEPSPRHTAELRNKCSAMMDAGHGWQINICPFGLMERTGWMRIFEKQDPRGDSFFSELYLGDQYIDNRETNIGILCPVVDVADFVLSNIVPPDKVIIKIDTEGSEFPILKRILESPEIHPLIEQLLIEWHGTGTRNGQHEESQRLCKGLEQVGIILHGWSY